MTKSPARWGVKEARDKENRRADTRFKIHLYIISLTFIEAIGSNWVAVFSRENFKRPQILCGVVFTVERFVL